jgi:transcriptional regulator with XRE-family HTH domain
VPTLEELISTRKAERGWSYAALADRAGGVLSAQRWQQLGTGVRIKEFPEPATLRAMAEALDMNISAVVLSAARSTGLEVKNELPILAQQLPASANSLEPDVRNAIVALVRAITKGQANDEDQEPGTEARGEELGGAGGRSKGRTPPMNPVSEIATRRPVSRDDPDAKPPMPPR